MAFNWKGTEGILTICGIIIAVIILAVSSYFGLKPKKKQEEQTNDNGNDDNSNKKSSDGKTTSIVGKKQSGKNGNKDKKKGKKRHIALQYTGNKKYNNDDLNNIYDDSSAFFKKDSTPPVIPNPNPAPTPNPAPAPDPNNPPPGPDSRLGPGRDIEVKADKKKVVVPDIDVDLPINDDEIGNVEEGDRPPINIPNDDTRSGMKNLAYSNYHDKETDNPDYIADLRLGIALNSTNNLKEDICIQPDRKFSVNDAKNNFVNSYSMRKCSDLKLEFNNFQKRVHINNSRNLSDAIDLLSTGLEQEYCAFKAGLSYPNQCSYMIQTLNNVKLTGKLLANFIRQNICEQNSSGDTQINALRKDYIKNVVPKFIKIMRKMFFHEENNGKFVAKSNGCNPTEYYNMLRSFVEGLIDGGLTAPIANLNGNDFKNLKKDIFQSLNNEVDKMVDYFKRNGDNLFAGQAKTKLDKYINKLMERDDDNISMSNVASMLLSPYPINSENTLPPNMVDFSMDPAQHTGMSGSAIQQINFLVNQFQIANIQAYDVVQEQNNLGAQPKLNTLDGSYILRAQIDLDRFTADAIAAIIMKEASNLTGANRDAFIAGHFIKINNDMCSKLDALDHDKARLNCKNMLHSVLDRLQRNMGGKKKFIKAINAVLSDDKKLSEDFYTKSNDKILGEVVKIGLDDINIGPAIVS